MLYLRIFPREISPRFHVASWIVIGALVAYALAFIIAFLVGCKPISYFWNIWDGEHEGHCYNTELIAYTDGGINV